MKQPLGQRIEVEVPKGPVEVVGPPDRASRLDAGVAVDGLASDGVAHLGITVAHGLFEHLSQLLGRERLVRSPASLGAWRLAAVEVLASSLAVGAVVVLGHRAISEVDLEGKVEGVEVILGLDQGGSQGGLEDLSLTEIDVRDGGGRVQVLGHRDGQPRRPEGHDELVEDLEHGSFGA